MIIQNLIQVVNLFLNWSQIAKYVFSQNLPYKTRLGSIHEFGGVDFLPLRVLRRFVGTINYFTHFLLLQFLPLCFDQHNSHTNVPRRFCLCECHKCPWYRKGSGNFQSNCIDNFNLNLNEDRTLSKCIHMLKRNQTCIFTKIRTHEHKNRWN